MDVYKCYRSSRDNPVVGYDSAMPMRMSDSLLFCRPSPSGCASRWLIAGGLVGLHARQTQGRKTTQAQDTITVITSSPAKPRTPITVLQQKHSKFLPLNIPIRPIPLCSASIPPQKNRDFEAERRGGLRRRRGEVGRCSGGEGKVAESMEMRKKTMLWLAFACTVGSLGLLVAPAMVHGRDSTPLSFVKKTVASHSIVIFSKSYCPYCKRAKTVFKELKEDPFVVELDQREDGSKIQDALFELVKRRTVPQVFIDGEHIGGSDDTVDAHRSGRLKKLLGSKQSGDQDLR